MPHLYYTCKLSLLVYAVLCYAVQQADLDDLRGLLENVIQERDAALTEVRKLEEDSKAGKRRWSLLSNKETQSSSSKEAADATATAADKLRDDMAQLKREKAQAEAKVTELQAAVVKLQGELEELREDSEEQCGSAMGTSAPLHAHDWAVAVATLPLARVVLFLTAASLQCSKNYPAQLQDWQRVCDSLEQEAQEQAQLLINCKMQEYDQLRLQHRKYKGNNSMLAPSSAVLAASADGSDSSTGASAWWNRKIT
eukprot:20715-Heterococcus_DN1.PRE.1